MKRHRWDAARLKRFRTILGRRDGKPDGVLVRHDRAANIKLVRLQHKRDVDDLARLILDALVGVDLDQLAIIKNVIHSRVVRIKRPDVDDVPVLAALNVTDAATAS